MTVLVGSDLERTVHLITFSLRPSFHRKDGRTVGGTSVSNNMYLKSRVEHVKF